MNARELLDEAVLRSQAMSDDRAALDAECDRLRALAQPERPASAEDERDARLRHAERDVPLLFLAAAAAALVELAEAVKPLANAARRR